MPKLPDPAHRPAPIKAVTTAFFALQLAALSVVGLTHGAFAQESGCEQTPPSCAAGTVWDPQSKSCVQVSS